jgi:glycosyltransferase involved in cell wall biosynthesis
VFHPEICPISCIKAQVGGAWPVTVNCGGMSDTLIPEFSNTGTHEDFAERLIATLKMGIAETERQKMVGAAREKFNWATIAKAWEAQFLSQLNSN